MNHDYERRSDGPTSAPTTQPDTVAPGQTSRSGHLRRPDHPVPSALVQRKATGASVSDTAVHDAAAKGLTGSSTALPYADRIQKSFGPDHDVSGISAHVGGPAASACDAIGASAYATGNSVAFRSQPDLHTAAHEAAHVVQQARGISLYGGVGQVGDIYEQQADAVADRVVAGQSAADLLGSGSSGGSSAAVQRNAAAGDAEPQTASADEVAATAQAPADDAAGFAGPSSPVDRQTAAAVGAATGTDVSGARLHDNPKANALARAAGAAAVTAGPDIAVADGENINQPGNKVLAHELAHVAQSGGADAGSRASLGGDTPGPGAAEVGASNAAAEVEAHIVAEAATATMANAGEAAAHAGEKKEVPDLPPDKLSPLELKHLQDNGRKRVLRGWNADQTLSEQLDLWPSNLVVKMKQPPNIVKSLYAGAWEPKVYFNHEWSSGGKGRFILGGIQHASWDDGNEWTSLAGVPIGKLAVPTDDYEGAKTQAEAQMSRRPDFRWNDRTVRVSAPVMTFRTAFDAKPAVTAGELGYDRANATHLGATDYQNARDYTTTFTQSVAKSVTDSAMSSFGHTTAFSGETSIGLKGTGSKGEDKSGKLGVEASFGQKWTDTETEAAQRSLGETYNELTQTQSSSTMNFPISAGVHAIVLVVPATKKVTSTFSVRGGLTDAGMILSNESLPTKKVLQANIPKGMVAIYGYDVQYAKALEQHHNECLELYQKAKGLPAGAELKEAKETLRAKIVKFSSENKPNFERAMAHAEAILAATSPSPGQNTKNAELVSGDNILEWNQTINQIRMWLRGQ